MTMKHFRLFLMTLLLIGGSIGALASTVSYRVFFDEDLEVNGVKAGYTLKTTSLRYGTITSGANAMILVTSYNYGTPTAITNSNVNDYVKANDLEDYTETVYVNSGGEIVVKYVYSGSATIITWDDGVFEYSNYFVKASCSEKLLPEGEVAVRLLMDTEREITDTVMYDTRKYGTGTSYHDDDDEDDAFGNYGSGYNTGTAKFEYISSISSYYNDEYYYKRTHKVNVSLQSSVTVPRTATYKNKTYNVTAIQKFGFVYTATAQTDQWGCSRDGFNHNQSNPSTSDNKDSYWHDNINDHRNYYLTSVDFGLNSNVKEIGDYAFMSCEALEDITIPWTVDYLGVGAFMSCLKLNEVTFQECPNFGSDEFGTTRIRRIENWTFWSCEGLKTIYLADGITRIEGLSYGASFQYLPQLTYIRLPNTLTYIGPHFLCSCTAIQKVTIPASVTYIDGACFHGCESLNEVYLLGSPADIQATYGTGSGASKTFDTNGMYCGSHVNTCKFYVRADYLEAYQDHATWGLIDEHGDCTNGKYGNELLSMPEVTRDFVAGKWATVIFPQRTTNHTGYVNCKTDFGDGTIVAELTGARRDDANPSLYHLTFTAIDNTKVPVRKPFMIKPGDNTLKYVMYNADDQSQTFDLDGDGTKETKFTDDMNDEHRLNVQSSNDGTVVSMKGKYVAEVLKRYDFVFKSAGAGTEASPYTYSFRKLMDGSATAGACKCWWTFYLGGLRNSQAGAKSLMFPLDDMGTTSIEKMDNIRFVVDAIYDMQGRRIELKQEELPEGLYIVNGKKVLVK